MRLSNKKINYYFRYRYRDHDCINVFSTEQHDNCVAAVFQPGRQPSSNSRLYFVLLKLRFAIFLFY